MEMIVEELIQIEKMADAVLDKLAKDHAALPKRINAEIARRTDAINRKTEKTLQHLYKAAQAETDEKIEQIALDSARGCSMVNDAFDRHREEWRTLLTGKILA